MAVPLVLLDDLNFSPVNLTSAFQGVDRALIMKDGRSPNLEKCKFCSNKVLCFGQIIGSGILEIVPHTTKTITGLQLPKIVTEPKSFLGICSPLQIFPTV